MPRNKKMRRRPSTPNLKLPPQHLHLTANPTSPPETPIPSPLLARSKHPSLYHRFSRPLLHDPNIRPVGNGHKFSYQPIFGPEHLSPRSSSSSEVAGESDNDVDDDSSASEDVVNLPNAAYPVASSEQQSESEEDDESDSNSEPNFDSKSADSETGFVPGSDNDSEEDELMRDGTAHITAIDATVFCDFTIEDVDPMDSECDGLEVLHPTEIESNRSRSKSRTRDLDTGMMHDLKNLNCSNEPSDNEADGEFEFDEEAFLQRQQELKRIRRVSMSSSVGKRTYSELSDSDGEDGGALDVNDVGSSARRMRKRLHRGSLLFQDPPEPRIDELEEPDSSEDEYAAEGTLAAELPYYSMEIIEVVSD